MLLPRRTRQSTSYVLPNDDPVDVSYAIKELFYSLQGEGAHTGRPAVFCRFAGCNLWSGREADRESAICQFCDTDFRAPTDQRRTPRGRQGRRRRGRGALAPDSPGAWLSHGRRAPLQLDAGLVQALKAVGFAVALETNGTLPPPAGIDWVCVSPKAGAALTVTRGNELKVVVPQPALDLNALPTRLRAFLGPTDGRTGACREHPSGSSVLLGPPAVAPQSANTQEARSAVTDEFELRSSFGFEAAHHLPAVPPDHRCHRIHGHSYSVEVRVVGPAVAPYDWAIDLGEIEKACDGVRNELDHRLLNDVPGLEIRPARRWLAGSGASSRQACPVFRPSSSARHPDRRVFTAGHRPRPEDVLRVSRSRSPGGVGHVAAGQRVEGSAA